MPHGRSCTVNNCHVANPMPYHKKCETRDFFQINYFLQRYFLNFFLRDENQNGLKLTKIIFNPTENLKE